MNLYEVVSETLYEVVPILDFGQGPEEPYRIYEKVVAETPAKAKYAAWKQDCLRRHCLQDLDDMRNMPKFTCELLEKDVREEAGIYT